MKKYFVFITKHFRFCILLSVLVFSASPASAKWLRIETQNFIVYSEAKEKRTLEFLTELERYRKFLIRHGGVAPRGNALKLKIFFTRNRIRYQALASNKGSVGMFTLTPDGPVAMFYEIEDKSSVLDAGKQVLFHEYVHYLQRQSPPTQYPLWYREGFAEYLSSVQFTDEGTNLGKILFGRARSLSYYDWLETKDMLEAQTFLKKGYMFYAQSWLLTHMLYTSQDYRDGVSAFLDLLEEEVEPEEALERIYGIDTSKLHIDLLKYFKDGDVLTYRYPPVNQELAVLSQQKLSKAQSINIDKAIRLWFANGDKSYRAIIRSIKKQLRKTPQNIELNLALANAFINLEKWRDAETVIRAVLKKSPNLPEAHALVGEIILQREWSDQKTQKADLPNEKKLVEARDHLAIANAKMPENARSRKWHAGSFIYGGHNDFIAAEKYILEAYALYPQNWQIRRQYADLLYARTDYVNACKLYKPLFRTSRSEDEKERLTTRMKYMTDNYYDCQFAN